LPAVFFCPVQNTAAHGKILCRAAGRKTAEKRAAAPFSAAQADRKKEDSGQRKAGFLFTMTGHYCKMITDNQEVGGVEFWN